MTIRASMFGMTSVALLVFAPAGSALDLAEGPVATHGDWSVFVDGDPTWICWGVTTSRAPPGIGGPRRLYVTFNFGSAGGEVSLGGGDRFAPDVSIHLSVGGNGFTLYAMDDWAWSLSPAEDEEIVAALASADAASVTISSGDGATTDRFSMLGVREALDDAARRCVTDYISLLTRPSASPS